MNRFATSRALTVLLLVSTTVCFLACDNKQFVKQIDSFQKGIDDTTSAIGIYYTELNSLERDLYLQERLYDPKKEVFEFDSQSKPTALQGKVFSSASIKARTDAIQEIGTYGKRLAALAGTTGPADFASGSTAVGENLKGLSETFGKLTNDSTASKYVEPIGALSTIFGAIGRMVLESKRDGALKKAINDASPKINLIIDLLEKDLKEIIGPVRQIEAQKSLALIVDFYNQSDRSKWSFDERRARLNEIGSAQARYDIAVTFNPSQLMKNLRDANDALVKFANSPGKPQNLVELISTLDDFRERAAVIAGAVNQLRALRRSE